MDLTVICQGCLSQDRRLKPLGEFEKLFKAIFRHSFDVFKMGIRSSDLLLCWECFQIMKNIDKFHNKVVETQITLSKHIKQYSNNNVLETLSSLKITQISQNESITAEQKLGYLNEISIFKVAEQDCKEKVLDIAEMSSENSKKSHNTHEDETFDVNLLENLKEEMNCDDNYDEDIIDETISPNNEIKEEKKLNTIKPKRKAKPTEKKIAVKKKPKVLNKIIVLENSKNEYETEYSPMLKKKWFKKYLYLLNLVPGSVGDNVLQRFASEENSLKCTKCNEICYNETDFTSHVKRHFQKYMCRLCADDYIYDENHIIRHVQSKHKTAKFRCRICRMRFISLEEYDLHKNECRIYKCNDCTEVFKYKRQIEAHCSKHTTYKCIDCNVPLKNINMYRAHKRRKHSKIKTEAAYCVECDIQFASDILMRNHLKTSVKHVKVVPRRVPCPECPNVYSSVKTRNYHYNKAHKGVTKYYCQICDKYCINNFNLRLHKQLKHDKIPLPKDKLCPHCGRGFSNNKILTHHIYTHTGERPYECSYCGAKYAQKYARDMHMKNIHKHGIKT